MTIGQALAAKLIQAGSHGSEEVAPAAVLWADPDRLWEAAIPEIRQLLPSVLQFGPYSPSSMSGPAIWIRTVLAGCLEVPLNGIPVVYLPGVAASVFRLPEDAPKALLPLIELHHRGVRWRQSNGKDWTPAALLESLGLDVARDASTLAAVQQRLPKLLASSLGDLKALGHLDSVKLHNLGSDWPAAILKWLEHPAEPGDDWSALRAACKAQFNLDPQTDGALVAAESLAEAKGSWAAVWSRFAEAPKRYPGVVELLSSLSPTDLGGVFAPRRAGYPKINRASETELRIALRQAALQNPGEARTRVLELDALHSERRDWVWTRLGQSPLAEMLGHLGRCAQITNSTPSTASLATAILRFTETGWQADQAAWMSYAAVSSVDAGLVGDLLRSIYLPWLRDAAESFSTLSRGGALQALWSPIAAPSPGECLLFADGLRYDAGKMLGEALERTGATVALSHRVCGLPSVTPTAKPAVSPITGQLTGTDSGSEFRPSIQASGKPLHIDRFRELLKASDIQVLGPTDTGNPKGFGWTEAGALDRRGHDEGALLARRIPDEVKLLGERVHALLDAGWKTVRVITDHGWLWMPGGLPKTELPAYLAETRWGRCAALKEGAHTDLHTVPWHYAADVVIAVAPGISCFKAGVEYSHGGLSAQECVVPVLSVRRPVAAAAAEIESVVWTGLRCKVKASGPGTPGVDIRSKPADSASSIAVKRKTLDAKGEATLFAKDEYEGVSVMVVLLDSVGQVMAKAPTIVGGTQ